jgi:hypothetical protein
MQCLNARIHPCGAVSSSFPLTPEGQQGARFDCIVQVCFVVIASSQYGSPLTANQPGMFDLRNSTSDRPPVSQTAVVWREIAATWQCSAGQGALSPSQRICTFFLQNVILFQKLDSLWRISSGYNRPVRNDDFLINSVKSCGTAFTPDSYLQEWGSVSKSKQIRFRFS